MGGEGCNGPDSTTPPLLDSRFRGNDVCGQQRQHPAMTRKEAAFIRNARVGHLATADEHGQPLNVPFCFAFDGECLYSPIDEKPKAATPQELKRIRNIRANPRVSVVVHHYDDEDWSCLAHVIIQGEASILTEGDAHRKAVRLLRRKYSQYRTMALDERPIIRIRIVRCIRWGRV